MIIDLGWFKGVEVDRANQTAILKGSILSKEVAVALVDAGLFTGEYDPDNT